MVERTNSVKAALPGRRRWEQPGYHSPLMLLRPILAAVLCLCPWVLTACPPAEMTPCFPPASSSVTDEGAATPGRLERPALDWEIDKLPALTDAPEGDPHQLASDTFVKAQRDMKTEFWLEAARDLLTVVRGDTKDGRKVRQLAEFDLAIALFRLRYYGEARQIFGFVAGDAKHPMQRDAVEWMNRRICGG